MRAWTIGLIAVACLALTGGTAMLTARGQQARPGEIGPNHVFVDNRYPEQAIPVVVQRTPEALRVQVTGTHTVTIDPMSTVPVRAVRQQWEYRTLSLGADRATALTAAGLEGWEAVGFQTNGAGTELLLKRPR